MPYSVIRAESGHGEILLEETDPSLNSKESRLALIEEIDAIRAAILERRRGVPLDLDEILDEMKAERGQHHS